ncbi:unnamed protein product, partial [Sphagnum balticum]
YRKILIFSQMQKTLEDIEKSLDKEGVKFWILSGTTEELSRIAAKFNKYQGNCALLIC